jgi:hypothetical protein
LPRITWDKQTFPSLEDKWNAFPSGVVDPQCRRCEGRAERVGRNSVVIEIPRLAVRGDILAKKGIVSFDRRDTAEDFDLDARRNMLVSSATGLKRHQTFSSRISSAAKETGRSIVKILKTCSKSTTHVLNKRIDFVGENNTYDSA